MRRFLFFLCSASMLLTFFSNAHAQECVVVYDSLHIPTEEIENFTKNNETDVVIKLYYMPSLLSCICQERTISVRDYIQNELDTFPQRLVSVSAEDLLQDQWTQSTGRLHTFLQAILYPERIFETAGLSENPEILETYAFESGDSGSVYVY